MPSYGKLLLYFIRKKIVYFFYKLETIASFGDAKVANIGDGGI